MNKEIGSSCLTARSKIDLLLSDRALVSQSIQGKSERRKRRKYRHGVFGRPEWNVSQANLLCKTMYSMECWPISY